jgi:hypothetical protein
LDRIKKNLDYIDWQGQFSSGISLLGGELYFIEDKDLQDSFLELIDLIIEKVLKASPNPDVRYSTVTNGLYNPEFLIRVLDKIAKACGTKAIDINFSYDLMHRYKSEEDRLRVIDNVNLIHNRYNYCIGIQMILTQNVINLWRNGIDIVQHIEDVMPGNQLCFLYPHPIHTGKKLDDFFFNRSDLFAFLAWLKTNYYREYAAFMKSTLNSATYKWTGLKDIDKESVVTQPKLTDGKEEITECGHSVLYRCYADSDKCMLCDLIALDEDAIYD